MVMLVLFDSSSNFTFAKWNLYKIYVTVTAWRRFASTYLRKWKTTNFGEWSLRSSELFRAHTPKRKLLPETGLIGPVQNLGIHQKFTFPNDIILLRGFNPYSFKDTFNSTFIYNQLGMGTSPANF
jgi:hypothetical protein